MAGIEGKKIFRGPEELLTMLCEERGEMAVRVREKPKKRKV
ncbi:MAG TPA: hypothetical protein VMB78_02605 [Dissulfurispiraceae bacterium]|nr:hypothetical protein [Dissulfurispiraceae bacterium]